MPFVGASLLAKNVNDNARFLDIRGVHEFFASKLAPTKPCGNKVDKLCRLFLRVATELAPLLHLPLVTAA
ncbi:hypothetical protein TU82_01300 [Pseudomonas orientalis]|nr:hypothetical protein TU82_01300 [Pseudomonas orientalis]